MSIGTKHETSLHRELKFAYTGQGGQTEVEVGSYVADGVNAAGEFIEVQTGSFGSLKRKAKEIPLLGKLRIIYPVIVTKYLEVYDAKGKYQYRRKSPRRGSTWDIFSELIHAPELPLSPNLVIEIVLVDAAEKRISDGKGSWRRQGVSIADRRLLVLHESICLQKPKDYLRFIPFKKKEIFTSALLGERAGISVDVSRKTLYVLTKIGIVKKIGKQGRALCYRIVSSEK